MKVVIRAEEINYTVYRYLAENGYTHAAFTFRQEAKINTNLALLPTVGGGRAKAHFPPHCLISLIQKALLYLWIEYHTDKTDGSVIKCQQQFSLFKTHTCRKPATARSDSVSEKAAPRRSSVKEKAKEESYAEESSADDHSRLAMRLTHDMPKSDYQPFNPKNGPPDAYYERADSSTIGFWREKNLLCLAVRSTDNPEWRTIATLEPGREGVTAEEVQWDEPRTHLLVWWKGINTNSGDLTLYHVTLENQVDVVDLGSEALQLMNVDSLKWIDANSFKVTLAARRDYVTLKFRKDDKNNWIADREGMTASQ